MRLILHTSNFYRMVQITGLATSDVQLNIKPIGIYPNPTNGILNVKADSSIESVNITNVVGQKINIQLFGNQIDIRGLPNGVYILELKLKDEHAISKKVVKN